MPCADLQEGSGQGLLNREEGPAALLLSWLSKGEEGRWSGTRSVGCGSARRTAGWWIFGCWHGCRSEVERGVRLQVNKGGGAAGSGDGEGCAGVAGQWKEA